MNRLEDLIRDYLVGQLELLETGITLVAKEYTLPNPDGAGGRIDIVAKDRFGHYVVIEIKRSNQAARQALHEIHKYTALFRQNLGLDERKIRLMVVSTEWHELLLPLAEFAKNTPYTVEGFEIEASSTGVVVAVSKVLLESVQLEAGNLKFSRSQGRYLFRDAGARDEFMDVLASKLSEVGIVDFALLNCDYEGGGDMVIYPWASYLCFVSPLEGVDPAQADAIKSAFDWEEVDQPDENFLCALEASRTFKVDDFEMGFPEKLSSAESIGWRLVVARRGGRLKVGSSVISDDDVLKLAKASEGGSEYYFGGVSSPRFRSSWESFCENVFPVLKGYTHWEKVVPAILEEVHSHSVGSVVTVYAYGPADLLVSFYAIALNDDYSRCPHFEIVVEDAESSEVRIVSGVLVWDSEKLIGARGKGFGDIFEWMWAQKLGGAVENEIKALRSHNLKAAAVEWRFSNGKETGPVELTIDDRGLVRRVFDQTRYKSLREFALLNESYLSDLQARVETCSTGLRESLLGAEGAPV